MVIPVCYSPYVIKKIQMSKQTYWPSSWSGFLMFGQANEHQNTSSLGLKASCQEKQRGKLPSCLQSALVKMQQMDNLCVRLHRATLQPTFSMFTHSTITVCVLHICRTPPNNPYQDYSGYYQAAERRQSAAFSSLWPRVEYQTSHRARLLYANRHLRTFQSPNPYRNHIISFSHISYIASKIRYKLLSYGVGPVGFTPKELFILCMNTKYTYATRKT